MIIQFNELEVGKWYMPVFERIELQPNYTGFMARYNTESPFYKYLGDAEFMTEDGDPVDYFYDPELGLIVNVLMADGFIQ